MTCRERELELGPPRAPAADRALVVGNPGEEPLFERTRDVPVAFEAPTATSRADQLEDGLAEAFLEIARFSRRL